MVSFLQGSSPCVKQWNLWLVQVVFDEHYEKVDVKNGKDRVLVGNGSFQKLNRSADQGKQSFHHPSRKNRIRCISIVANYLEMLGSSLPSLPHSTSRASHAEQPSSWLRRHIGSDGLDLRPHWFPPSFGTSCVDRRMQRSCAKITTPTYLQIATRRTKYGAKRPSDYWNLLQEVQVCRKNEWHDLICWWFEGLLQNAQPTDPYTLCIDEATALNPNHLSPWCIAY